MTRQEYVDALKSAIVTGVTKSAVGYLIAQLPFLSPFRFIIDAIIERLVSFLVNKTELGLFFMYVDFRTNAQAKDFEQSAIRNYLARKWGNADEIKLAEVELLESFRNFAKFTS